MKKLFLVLALILMLVPAVTHAAGTSVLLGAQSVSFGADLDRYYDIPPGPGISLIVAFEAGIPIDLRIGRRTTIDERSDGDLTYQWIELGPRFSLGVEGTTIQPDWFFGVGSYDLEIEPIDFDTAIGAYMGIGVQETLSEKFLGRLEVKGVIFKSDTLQTDAASLNLSLLFGFKF